MGVKMDVVLSRLVRMLSALRLTSLRDARLSRLDFGILEIALMMAALDGDVLSSETAAFSSLAKRCRGYSEKSFRLACEKAYRSAGYLLLLARNGTRDELMRAFVTEALAALPAGFTEGKLSDVRRAFVMWIAMGISDGTFSSVERQAVETLRRALAEIRRAKNVMEFNRWVALSPAFRQAAGTIPRATAVPLVSEAFVTKAETLIRQLSGTDARDAEAALEKLIFAE